MTGSIVVAATIALTGAGVFIFRKFITRVRKKKETKLQEDQRNAVRYVLEIFQRFHWEALNFAILSEEFKRKKYDSLEEYSPEKTELLDSYAIALSSLQDELKNLDGKLDSNEIVAVQTMLSVDIRKEVEGVVQTLIEACQLAKEQSDLKECFKLVETAYRDSAQVEKALRSLYRKLS